MSIQTGQALPTAHFKSINASVIHSVDTATLFKGRKVAGFDRDGTSAVCMLRG